ncbi:MAG: hypothetical protein ACPLWB_01005 [Caldisericia bacterium]
MGFNISYPEMLAGWMYNNHNNCSNITSGHTENWQNVPIGWIYFFDGEGHSSGLWDFDHVGICSMWSNGNRYVLHAYTGGVREGLISGNLTPDFAACLVSIGQ